MTGARTPGRTLACAFVAWFGVAACSGEDTTPPTASTADEVVDGLHRQGVLIAYKVETSQRNDLDRGSLDDRLAYFRTEGARVNVLLYPSPGALHSKAEEDKRLAGATDR